MNITTLIEMLADEMQHDAGDTRLVGATADDRTLHVDCLTYGRKRDRVDVTFEADGTIYHVAGANGTICRIVREHVEAQAATLRARFGPRWTKPSMTDAASAIVAGGLLLF